MDYCPVLGDGRWLNTVGLIVGVILLTSAVLVSKKAAAELAATKWNGNQRLQDALRRQSRRGWYGLFLLVPGILLQIAGTWCAD